MVKKIKAPKTYDPGKGRPKEHLAYLNEREMAYLRSINGNNMERGPKGLPSFPPSDAIGSSSVSRPTSSTMNNSPQSGGRGAGSNYGSGSGRPGTTPSSGGGGLGQGGQGSGSRGTSTPASGGSNLGQGGQRGAGSNYGPGSGRPSTMPAGGSPTSAGGLRGAGSNYGYGSGRPTDTFNADKRAQQQAQSQDARKAVSTPALSQDLTVGGIKSLRVGPMNVPVAVKPTAQVYKLAPLTREPTFADRINATAGQIAQSISDAAKYATNYATTSIFGEPPKTKASGPLGEGAYERVPQTENIRPTKLSGPLGFGAYDRVPQEGGPAISTIEKPGVISATAERLREQYGAYKNPAAPRQEYMSDEEARRQQDYNDALAEAERIAIYSPDPVATGNPRMVGIERRIGAPLPAPSMPGPVYRGINIDRALQASAPLAGPNRVLGAPPVVREPSFPTSAETPRTTPGYNRLGVGPEGIMSSAFTEEYVPGEYAAYRVGADIPSPDENPIQSDTVDSPNISPTTQMPPPGLPERTWPQKIFERTSIGQLGRLMNWGIGKEYENLTPQEQADLMGRWIAQRDQYIRNQSPRNDRRDYMGPDVSGGSGRGNREPTERQPTTPTESGRPQIYYMWDVGVNIPSPGDSNYTLYQQYLAERDSAYG